jgi:hypothetical protein
MLSPETMHTPRLDSVRPKVLWNRLVSIVQEAETVLVRTSFSSTVGEANDYGAALLDARGQILTQRPKGSPNGAVDSSATTRLQRRDAAVPRRRGTPDRAGPSASHSSINLIRMAVGGAHGAEA